MLLWLCALSLFTAGLQAEPVVAVSYRVGFDNIVPRGKPAPLTILVENSTAEPVDVSIRLTDERAFGAAAWPSHQLSISPGVGKQFTFLVEFGEFQHATLVFNSDHEVTWQNKDVGASQPEPSKEFVQPVGSSYGVRESSNPVVVMGGRAAQLVGALGGGNRGRSMLEGRDSAGRELWFTKLDTQFAPDNQLGWAGVQLVIWTEPDVAAMGDESQYTALRNWVRCGGKLVILSATQPRLLTAAELKPLLPVTIQGAKTLTYPGVPTEDESHWVRKPSAAGVHFVADYHQKREIWIEDATGPLLQAKPDPSAVYAPPGTNWSNLPLLGWEKRYGAGIIFVAAFDPLVYDQGQTYPLLQATAVATGLNFRFQDDYSYDPNRVENIHGSRERHLRNGLVHGNVLRLSLAPYILLALLFLVLIGPVDYFVLAKYKKLKFSAFTLVGYALLFTAGAVVSTFFLFAPSAETNRISFVDFTELEDGSEYATGYVLHGTYRPLGDVFTCDMPENLVFGSEISNVDDQGKPAAYFGPGRHPAQIDQPFNSFRMIRTIFAGKPTGTISGRISESDGGWELELTNGLAAPLQGGVLRFGTRAMVLPEVAPGETVKVDLSRKLWQSINNINLRVAQSVKLEGTDISATPDLPQWLLADAATGADTGVSAMPWEARMRPGEALLYGLTTDYPFLDSFGDDDTGFNLTVVRRRMEIPASMQKALQE